MRGRRTTRERLGDLLTRRRVLAALGGLGGLGAAAALLGGDDEEPEPGTSTERPTRTIVVPRIGRPPTEAPIGQDDVQYDPLNRARGYGGEPACRWTITGSEADTGRVAWELPVGTAGDTIDTPIVLGRDALIITTGRDGQALRVDPTTGTPRGGATDLTLTTEGSTDDRSFEGEFGVVPGSGLVNNHLIVPVEEPTTTDTPTVDSATAVSPTATGGAPPEREVGYRMFRVTGGGLVPVNQLVRSVSAEYGMPRRWVTGLGPLGYLADPNGGVVGAVEREIATAADMAELRGASRWEGGTLGVPHPGVVAAATDPPRRAYIGGDGQLALYRAGRTTRQRRPTTAIAGASVTIVGDIAVGSTPLDASAPGLYAFRFPGTGGRLSDDLGKPEWSVLQRVHSIAATQDDDQIVAAKPSSVLSIVPDTGETRWAYDPFSGGNVSIEPEQRTATPRTPPSQVSDDEEPEQTATPTATENRTASGLGGLFGPTVDLTTGSPAVSLAERSSWWVGTPVVSEESAYVPVREGEQTYVDRLALRDGQRLWRSEPLPPTEIPHVALVQGVVIVPIAPQPASDAFGESRPRIIGVGG